MVTLKPVVKDLLDEGISPQYIEDFLKHLTAYNLASVVCPIHKHVLNMSSYINKHCGILNTNAQESNLTVA